ncbi:M56 family metallopeptidase [Aliikangiella sp. G2MR2-5]|uniref:M56 family metallopeptidase n=1 Tax=Aliikangiella sp. G2MR2-5 TaxID=2788943 RepID=UPI0018A8CD6A|nr:M56 family metallopeptidase [Aliikangiella sp. G2MR2-5]
MLTYLAVNSLISLLVLLVVKRIQGQIDYRYYLTLFALIFWLIPIPYLKTLLPMEAQVTGANWLIPNVEITQPLTFVDNIETTSPVNLTLIAKILFSVGFLIFVFELIRHFLWKNSLKQEQCGTLTINSPEKIKVNLSKKISSAVLIGWLNPTIWMNPRFSAKQYMDVIVTHEITHLESHDNIKLLLLTLVKSLFWWNPLVRLLVKEIHFLIEASCDRKASNKLGSSKYLTALSEIMLQTTRSKPQLSSSMASSTHTNLKRIQIIKENPQMDTTRKITYMFTLTFSLALFALASFNTHSESYRIKQESVNMKKSEAPVSMHFEKIPLKTAFELIADFTEAKAIEVDKSIQNTPIDIEVEEISTIQLMDLMASHFNLKIISQSQKLFVKPGSGGVNAESKLVFVKDNKPEGAHISFAIKLEIKDPDNSEKTNTKKVDFSVWSEFDKQSFIKLPNNWQMVIKISDKDNIAMLDVKMLDSSKSPIMELIAEPKLLTPFGEEASIEMGDDNQMLSITIRANRSSLEDAQKG